jgi:glycerol-3-phosphate dehydrogenase
LIVNATGASVDRALAELEIPSRPLMGPTKGSHFVTQHPNLVDALGGRGVYAEAPDGRPVFVLPLGGGVLVGTTDVPFEQPPETAVATQEEVDYLVATVAALFPGVGFTRENVDFHYAGVRPLPRSDAASTAGVTRRHTIVEHAPPEPGAPPALSVIGGKLTTCRALAEIVADRVLDRLGKRRFASTRDRPLGGDSTASANADALAKSFSIDAATATELIKLFGSRATAVLGEIAANAATYGPLAARLVDANVPEAVVRWSIRHEWAETLDDLVERRMMLLYRPRLTRRCLRRIAELLAAEGKFAPTKCEEHVAATIDRLAQHYGKRVYDEMSA